MKNPPTILIVDDEPFNVDYLEQELEDLNYDTLSAFSGPEALELVEEHAPDLLLLDIMMPGMDGFAVLSRLKADRQTREIPVIIISAMSDINSVVKGISLGAEDYLPKPFEPMLLEARIRACLEKKRLRDQELDVLQQVERLTQAALAVENKTFTVDSLQPVAAREDALGRLARVFQSMASEVVSREQRLLQKLQQIQSDLKEMQQALRETPLVYLPADRIYALREKVSLPLRAEGAVLFADISGFTSLTEALAGDLGLKRGAEELTRHLNHTYERLVAQVHGYGGSVINFTGDAITCWFDDGWDLHPADAAWRATTCAWQMQTAIQALDDITIASGQRFSLAIKCAVVAGSVCRFLVGKADILKIEVLAGEILNTLALGELLATAGDILLHDSVIARLGQRIACAQWREDGQQRFGLLHTLHELAQPSPWPANPAGEFTPAQLRPWLLDPVFHRVKSGHSEDLSELRTVSALFLNFSGIDYEQDPQAEQKLDELISWVQQVVLAYDGYVLQFSTGDKGSYLYATFGAPVSCENDAVLAVSAAQSLLSPPAHLSFVESLRVGIARGQMRAGPYGSPQRRTYGAVGDKTNLAARLMMLADDGILCDNSIYQAAKDSFAFVSLPPIRVKGKSEPVALFKPTGATIPLVQNLIDQLAPGPHLTLKIASLVGDVFDLETLEAVYSASSGQGQVEEDLQVLLRHGLIQAVSSSNSYTFSNPVVRTTAYELLLFSQRRRLHAALAQWLEHKYADALEPQYPSLIYHWEQAEEVEKVLTYLERAGQHAHKHGDLALAMEFFDKARAIDVRAGLLSKDYHR